MLAEKLCEHLLNFCETKYKSPNCAKLFGCKNSCQSNCSDCLRAIHYPKDGCSRHVENYNCKNITYLYTKEYLCKYASEIYYCLNRIQEDLSWNNHFMISIGCGPCTEYLALTKAIDKEKVAYVGYDIETSWGKVQEEIKGFSNAHGLNFTYKHTEIFKDSDTIKKIKERPVIIVMNYLLSALHYSNKLKEFQENFYQKIIPVIQEGSCILINDTNHQNIRPIFTDITEKIRPFYNLKILKLHFCTEKIKHSEQRYGEAHKSPDVLFGDCSGYCTSVQHAIIMKRKL